MSSLPSSQAPQCDGTPRLINIKVRVYDSVFLSDKSHQPLDRFRIRLMQTASYSDLGKLVVKRIIQSPPAQGLPNTEVISILDEEGYAFDNSDPVDATQPNEHVCFVLAESSKVSTTEGRRESNHLHNETPERQAMTQKPFSTSVSARKAIVESAKRVPSSAPPKPILSSTDNRLSSNKTSGYAIKKRINGNRTALGGRRSVSGSSQKPKSTTETSQTVGTVLAPATARKPPMVSTAPSSTPRTPSKRDPYEVPSEDDDVVEAPKPARQRTNTPSKTVRSVTNPRRNISKDVDVISLGSSKGEKTPSPKSQVLETPHRIKSEHAPRSRDQTLKQIANGVKIHELDSDEVQPTTGPATPTPTCKIAHKEAMPDSRQRVRQQIASGVPIVALGDSSSSSSDDDEDEECPVIKSEQIVKPEPAGISEKALGKRSSHTINDHIPFARPAQVNSPQPIMARNSRGVFPVYRKGDSRAAQHEQSADRAEAIDVELRQFRSRPSLSSDKSKKCGDGLQESLDVDLHQRAKSQQPSNRVVEKFEKIPRRSRSKSVGPSSTKSSAANTPTGPKSQPSTLDKLNQFINERALEREFGCGSPREDNLGNGSAAKPQRALAPQEAVNECKKRTNYRHQNKLSQTSVPDSFYHETDESDSGCLPPLNVLPPKNPTPRPRAKTPVSSQASVWKTPQSRRSQISRRSTPFTPINTLRRCSPETKQTMSTTRIHRGYPKNMRDAFSDASKSPTPEDVADAIDRRHNGQKTTQKAENQSPKPVERKPWWDPEKWVKRYKTKFAADGPDCVWIAEGPYEGLIFAGPKKGDYISDCEAPSDQQLADMEISAELQDASDSESPGEPQDVSDSDSIGGDAACANTLNPALGENQDEMDLSAHQQEPFKMDPDVPEVLIKHEEPCLPWNALPRLQEERSPRSEESDRTSNLITKQLEDTYLLEQNAPPSNQELGEIMSSSPSKRWGRDDGLERLSVSGNPLWSTEITDMNPRPEDSDERIPEHNENPQLRLSLPDDILVEHQKPTSNCHGEPQSPLGREIRSFKEIAAMHSPQTPQPYDSDLEFVLDKSPNWLKDITEISLSPEPVSSPKQLSPMPTPVMNLLPAKESSDMSNGTAGERIIKSRKRASNPTDHDRKRKKVKLSKPNYDCESRRKSSMENKGIESICQRRLRTPKNEVKYSIEEDEFDEVITPRPGTPTPPVKLPSNLFAQQTTIPDCSVTSKTPSAQNLDHSPASGPQLLKYNKNKKNRKNRKNKKKRSGLKSMEGQLEPSVHQMELTEDQPKRKKSKKEKRHGIKQEEGCNELETLSSMEFENVAGLQNMGKSLEIVARGSRSPSLSICDTPPLVNRKKKRQRSKSVPPQPFKQHDPKPTSSSKPNETKCEPDSKLQLSRREMDKKEKKKKKKRDEELQGPIKKKKHRDQSSERRRSKTTGLPPTQEGGHFTTMMTPPATSRHTSPESKVNN